MSAVFLACAAALFLTATFLMQPAWTGELTEPWNSPLGQDHQLAGRIWDISAASFIDATTLVERLARSRFVLLGEKHDNADHHRLQAWLLKALIAAGRRPAVGFEMFTIDDGPAIARHLTIAPTDAVGLADAVDWKHSGWPDWTLYQPIVEAALQARLPIVATNLPKPTAQALGRQGMAALDPSQVARLGLDRPLPPDTHAQMAAEIRDAHCGYASEERVEAMILVQRARDAQMAERLVIAGGRQDGAVLIAGAGHVRKDSGVPTSLATRAPDATVSSLTFLEVTQGITEPAAYATRFQRGTLPFDYIWFTPRTDDLDPCEKFGTQLENLRK